MTLDFKSSDSAKAYQNVKRSDSMRVLGSAILYSTNCKKMA